MTTSLALLEGTATGIVSSLCAWWVLFHVLSPRLEICETIAKSRFDGDTYDRYLIKIRNRSRRDVVDVSVVIRLRVHGLIREQTIEAFDFADRDVIPIIRGRKATTHRLRLEDIPLMSLQRYGNYLPSPLWAALQVRDHHRPLEWIFWDQRTEIVVWVFATDTVSGTRRHAHRPFRGESIRAGRFIRGSCEVDSSANGAGTADPRLVLEKARRWREGAAKPPPENE